MAFCFEDCHMLAATNPDYFFADADLPMLKEAFARWLNLIELRHLVHDGEAYVMICLPDEVEQEVAGKMFEQPSQAWALASLAYIMLRTKAGEVLGVDGCLPFPSIGKGLAFELEKKGLYRKGKITPRFSLFTYDPPDNGCKSCSLLAECPQKNNF